MSEQNSEAGTQFASLFSRLMMPFAPEQVESRDQGGVRLHYIDATTAANRLDDVLGPEEIVPIQGHDGYFASTYGRVGSIRGRGRKKLGTIQKTQKINWLKPYVNPRFGYEHVDLCTGKRRNARVNVIILETFKGPAPPGHECCHKDGNRRNNLLSNLYWGTRKQNMEDSRRHGTAAVGTKQPASKLNDDVVREIRLGVRSGVRQSFYVRKFGVTSSVISEVVSMKTWKHVKEVI